MASTFWQQNMQVDYSGCAQDISSHQLSKINMTYQLQVLLMQLEHSAGMS